MPKTGVIGQILRLFLVVTCLLLMGYVQATVYYVDQKNPAANDSNPGTKSAPWLSLYPASKVKLTPSDVVLVKAGHYRVDAENGKPLAIIDPRTSGEAGKPILFKSSPLYAATIEGDRALPAPIQVNNQSHIAIEGFRIVNPGTNGILIKGDINKPVDGVAIRNNIIIDEHGTDSSDFTDGIHIEFATNTVIENNRIGNANNKSRPSESTAIRLSNTTKQLVEYNEIANLPYGLRIQNNATNIEVGKNIIANTLQPILVTGEGNSSIQDLKISNNIFNSPEVAISLLPDGGIIRKTFVNNNVFNNYSVAAMQIVQPGMGKIEIWNNVFKSGDRKKSFIADIFTYDDPPLSIARMDYNLFAEQPLFITGLYSNNRRLFTLNAWQKFAEQDAHSVVSAVEFRDLAKNDFRLAKQSRHILEGTVDGRPSSSHFEVGAYTSAITQIGIPRLNTTEQVAKKSPNKSAKKATNTATVTTKHKTNVETTVNPIPATPAKTDATTPTQVAIAVPGDEQESLNKKSGDLDWQVERSLQFGGKCVLESNKIDFYDGYDNTGLKFRVLNNELYLLTKSNIDMSFNDVGIEISKNEFLHADKVVMDQDVLFRKEMPAFLSKLNQSSDIRVQLRFWPSYPATKTYSKMVAFNGFLSAYEAYTDCRKGE